MRRDRIEKWILGFDECKTPDIVFEFRRKASNESKIAKMTNAQRKKMQDWLDNVSEIFETYVNEIRDEIQTNMKY